MAQALTAVTTNLDHLRTISSNDTPEENTPNGGHLNGVTNASVDTNDDTEDDGEDQGLKPPTEQYQSRFPNNQFPLHPNHFHPPYTTTLSAFFPSANSPLTSALSPSASVNLPFAAGPPPKSASSATGMKYKFQLEWPKPGQKDGWRREEAMLEKSGVCVEGWEPPVPEHLYKRLPGHYLSQTTPPRPFYIPLLLTTSVYSLPNLPSESGTPLTRAAHLSRRLGCDIHLKREDLMGGVFSFKCRGAWNFMKNAMAEEEKWKGVVACSAGNHAQGVALAGHHLGIAATIVMPLNTPSIKYLNVERLGAKVVLHGSDFDEAKAECARLQKAHGLLNVPPYDDPYVIAGQGTVGVEILRQIDTSKLDAIFVAVGGGGLLAGIVSYVRAVAPPHVRVIGVETYDADALTKSLHKGERVTLNDVGLFSDGTAVKVIGEETFRIVSELLDEMILVTNDEICAAIKDIFEDTRGVAEPAGALALAGMKKWIQQNNLVNSGKRFVSVISGANVNFSRLRFVADRAEVGEKKEVIMSVVIPEGPGCFLKLYNHFFPRSVTEFSYRYSSPKKAIVFVAFILSDASPAVPPSLGLPPGVAVEDPLSPKNSMSRDDRVMEIIENLERDGMKARDISDNEMAKSHARFLVGGKKKVLNERVFSFQFPEKPGALKRFLESCSVGWNISMFHYRNTGGDVSKVLAGIQIPPEDKLLMKNFLRKLGYPYVDETDNPVYHEYLSEEIDDEDQGDEGGFGSKTNGVERSPETSAGSTSTSTPPHPSVTTTASSSSSDLVEPSPAAVNGAA